MHTPTPIPESHHPARYWHLLDDNRIQCDVCPRYCKLKDGQRGLCFVRQREGDKLILTTYGRSSGFAIDPIEKKPLNHFLPGTPVLSFGTAGCNLSCKFCQNWDISKSREMDTLMQQASPKTIAQAAKELGCRSVAYTYNDPIIFLEYAVDTAKECRAQGIQNIAVTAGYITKEARAEFFEYMDAVNVDLKGFTNSFYKKLCAGELEPVLDTLKYIRHKTDAWLEITTLIVPDSNDSDAELEQMTRWIMDNLGADVPLHFSAFHPDWKMQDVPATPTETLNRAREIALKNGLQYVYTGNVHDIAGGTTFCHHCGEALIKRDWYTLLEWHITDKGHCEYCGTKCAGVFEDKPGNWGAKRMAVPITQFAA